jgi:hypothetical protein
MTVDAGMRHRRLKTAAGIPAMLLAVLLGSTALSACAWLFGTTYLSTPHPLRFDLPVGTELVYEISHISGDKSRSRGAVIYRVAERIDGAPREITDNMVRSGREAVFGSTRLVLDGAVFRIESEFRPPEGMPPTEPTGLDYPRQQTTLSALWANSSAGIVRLPELGSEAGRLIAPSPDLDLHDYYDMTSAWYISHPDTIVTVPAGSWRCVETTSLSDPGVWRTYYWSDGPGMVLQIVREGHPLDPPASERTEYRLSEIRPPSVPR